MQCMCNHLRCRACSMLQSADGFIWRDCGDACAHGLAFNRVTAAAIAARCGSEVGASSR
jgi:hypothetical protein